MAASSCALCELSTFSQRLPRPLWARFWPAVHASPSWPWAGAGGCRGAPSCLQRGQNHRETGGSGGQHGLLGFLCTHTAKCSLQPFQGFPPVWQVPRERDRAKSPDHGGRKSPEIKGDSQEQDTFKRERGGPAGSHPVQRGREGGG